LFLGVRIPFINGLIFGRFFDLMESVFNLLVDVHEAFGEMIKKFVGWLGRWLEDLI
jgi:hypothetical protein